MSKEIKNTSAELITRYIPVRDYIKEIGIELTLTEDSWFAEYVKNAKDLERYLLLYALCKYKDCKTALEIGCAGGYGIRAMVKGGAEVVGIDIKSKTKSDKGYQIIKDDSKEGLLIHLALNQKFDLIFVDGSHDLHDVPIDLFLSEKLCNKYLVIHDYGLEKGVTEIVDRMFGKPKLVIQDNLNKLDAKEGIVIIEKS